MRSELACMRVALDDAAQEASASLAKELDAGATARRGSPCGARAGSRGRSNGGGRAAARGAPIGSGAWSGGRTSSRSG